MNIPKAQVSLVSAEEAEQDKNAMNFSRGEMSVDAIPDLDILTGKVLEILQFLEDEKVKKLNRSDPSAVKMMLNNKYLEVPYGILTLLLEEDKREENVEMLLNMFEKLNMAKAGMADLETIGNNFREEITEKYEYSKYGGKEGFEKELAKNLALEKKNKQKNK